MSTTTKRPEKLTTESAANDDFDVFDDGMSKPMSDVQAREFVQACSVDADPVTIATKLLQAGVKPDHAETILRHAWGNRQSPPKDKEAIRFYVSNASHRLWESSRVDLAANQHLNDPEPLDVHRVAKALYEDGYVRRAILREDETEQVAAKIELTPFQWREPAEIPQREWLYKPAYIAGYVSLTTAQGGGGKSTLVRAECAAIASGKPLLGIEPERTKVAYWCGEDPADELERSFAAIRLHYKLKREDLEGWLFVDSGRDMPIKIATMQRGAFSIVTPVVEALTAEIKAKSIGVLVIDPFVTSHNVPENDNTAMNATVDQWRKIADETGCAVHLVHHSRKLGGEVASIESARGASAVASAARVRRAINTMTAAQAAKAGIAEEERARHISADYTSTSFIPSGEALCWYRFESVNLGNGEVGDGESMGVVVPATVADMSLRESDEEAALDAIREGRWRKGAKAGEAWVGVPIARALGLNPEDKNHRTRLRTVIDSWLASGLLREEVGKGDDRHTVTFIVAGESYDFG